MATAPTPTAVRLTPLAALLDTSLRNGKDGRNLATTLAIMRMPSATWCTYETIAALLETHAGGRTLNRVSIKTYAEGVFGIPNTRYVRVGGKPVNMPRAVDRDTVERYLSALDARFIDVDAVRAEADRERAEQERRKAEIADQLASAVENSAAGNTADLGDFTQYVD
jgi:hypothetical protein